MQLNAIILAAGKGKRMGSKTLPKVLYELDGKPILSYVIKNIRSVGVPDPVIVVGFQGQKIIDRFSNCRYVWQKKRLGTAHAALQAKPLLKGNPGYTFVLYGDNPLLSADTLKRIVTAVQKQKATVGVAAAKAPEELGLGHIVTDKNGHVIDLIEQKVATKEIKHNFPWQNAGGWLVENRFLWPALRRARKNPITKEYFINDLVGLAVKSNKKVIMVPVKDPHEAIGINTLEHLKQAQRWLRTKQRV